MIEVRWHGRAGQGAKTASQLLALAELRAGRFVQAFPEYGPERSGAPMRAYTRIDDRPIRRRYAIERPDAVAVLDDSLLREVDVTEGLGPDGLLVVLSDTPVEAPARVVHVPGAVVAAAGGERQLNVIALGALAAALGEPTLDELVGAVEEIFGRKKGVDAARAAVAAGYDAVAAGVPA